MRGKMKKNNNKRKLTKNRIFYGCNEDEFTIRSRKAIRNNMNCIDEEEELNEREV